VVGPAAAADADVVHAELARAAREGGHLEARALEGLELDGKQVPAVGARQRLERRRLRGRAIRHGLGGDRHVHRAADLLEQRKHRGGPARAVQADERGPAVGGDPARVDVAVAVERRVGLHAGERHHRRQVQLLADLQAMSASPR
jgi:hypothetical protein